MTLDRRDFLTRAGASAVAGVAGAQLLSPGLAGAAGAAGGMPATGSEVNALNADGPAALPVRTDPNASLPVVPFHGPHQAGITTARQPAACFVSFDVVAGSRGALVETLKALTETARFLTGGGVPPNLGSDAPPSDSGTLGPLVPADGLTVTVSVGSTLFDDRFGLAPRRPVELEAMEPFPNDDLDPAQTGGDLFPSLCAGSPDTALHALRQIATATRAGLQINWRLDGFASPSRPTGTSRNHFAFKDGIANPIVSDPQVANALLWVQAGSREPPWAAGGTYHAVRIIRQLIEFWDRVSIVEQQQMIGRYRDSGAPLDGTQETDTPDYVADPRGNLIPLTAHIRLANPRTKASETSRILRRGYNYDRGVDLAGNLDTGLLFHSFQQSLRRQFIATQLRLVGEPMVDYVLPVGGGYFFALPGVRDERDWYASGLFA
jgi:deferrochelatase/peroxidase EfeB